MLLLTVYHQKGLKLPWLPDFKEKALVLVDAAKMDRPVVVTFCSSQTIKKHNKLYRCLDKVTDVLSWGYDPPSVLCGEMLLCVSKIKEQAKINNWSYTIEALRLFVHGIAHIKGYDHEQSATADRQMLIYEVSLLNRVGLGHLYD